MADSKISALTALSSPANDDEFVVVDTDAGSTKRITFSNLNTSISSSVADDSITQAKIANDAVGADELASNAVVNASVASGAAIAFSKMANLTTERALVSDANGDVSTSAVTNTEIGYLDGVTSAIQTQLNSKSHINYNLTKTANYTAVAGDKILCDTSSGAFTITLPASPSAGDEVHVLDATASFDSNNLTVGRNSKKIQAATNDLTITTQNTGIGLVFYNDTYGWRVLVDAYDVDVTEL